MESVDSKNPLRGLRLYPFGSLLGHAFLDTSDIEKIVLSWARFRQVGHLHCHKGRYLLPSLCPTSAGVEQEKERRSSLKHWTTGLQELSELFELAGPLHCHFGFRRKSGTLEIPHLSKS